MLCQLDNLGHFDSCCSIDSAAILKFLIEVKLAVFLSGNIWCLLNVSVLGSGSLQCD